MAAKAAAEARLEAVLEELLASPGEGVFTWDGTSRAGVYEMAARLRARLPDGQDGPPVCLAAADRAVIAAALLASLAGGPALALPYAFSQAALAGLRQATGAVLAITDSERELPAGMTPVRPADGEPGLPLAASPVRPDRELLRLYTGGTTGRPQLWSKTARNILGESLFLAEHFAVSSRDRIVATISPCHIYGLLYAVTLPLVSGAAVLAATPSYPGEIAAAARDLEATILISVPAHYRALGERSLAAPSLRLAFSSAGPLEIADNTAFCRRNGVEIVEVYGSTETGGIALRSRFRGESRFTPYPTLDWRGDGRLQVRSPYLSPGLELDGDGFFTTGDRVEAEGDGFLLKGRVDSIAKVAGNRVDLEEVGAAIRDYPGVRDCLVLALEEGGGRQRRLVAMVEGREVAPEDLRRYLGSRLEPYALPKTIKVVEQLPVKENGKYDRRKILRLLS